MAIPVDTPKGTVVYELDGSHDDPFIWFVEQTLDYVGDDGIVYFENERAYEAGWIPRGLMRSTYLTKKEAAAVCLASHVEVLEQCYKQIAEMTSVLHGAD